MWTETQTIAKTCALSSPHSVSVHLHLSFTRTPFLRRSPFLRLPAYKQLPLFLACFVSTQASGEASGLQETDGVAEMVEAVTYTQAPVSTGFCALSS